MNYNDLFKRIKKQRYYFMANNRKEPNQIIMGIDIYSKMTAEISEMVVTYNKIDTVYGMEIVIDHRNEQALKIGYVENITVEEESKYEPKADIKYWKNLYEKEHKIVENMREYVKEQADD